MITDPKVAELWESDADFTLPCMTERWRWSFHVVTGFVWLTCLMNLTKTTRHQLPTCFVTTTSSLIYRLQQTKQSTSPSYDISERYGRFFRGDSNLTDVLMIIEHMQLYIQTKAYGMTVHCLLFIGMSSHCSTHLILFSPHSWIPDLGW